MKILLFFFFHSTVFSCTERHFHFTYHIAELLLVDYDDDFIKLFELDGIWLFRTQKCHWCIPAWYITGINKTAIYAGGCLIKMKNKLTAFLKFKSYEQWMLVILSRITPVCYLPLKKAVTWKAIRARRMNKPIIMQAKKLNGLYKYSFSCVMSLKMAFCRPQNRHEYYKIYFIAEMYAAVHIDMKERPLYDRVRVSM